MTGHTTRRHFHLTVTGLREIEAVDYWKWKRRRKGWTLALVSFGREGKATYVSLSRKSRTLNSEDLLNFEGGRLEALLELLQVIQHGTED